MIYIWIVVGIVLACAVYSKITSKPIVCPKCGKDKCERRTSTPEWHFKSYPYIRCPDCLHIFHDKD